MWCTVELEKTGGKIEEYPVHSKYFEIETGEKVHMKDLLLGNFVIWRSKGVPYYEVKVLETHRKLSSYHNMYYNTILK